DGARRTRAPRALAVRAAGLVRRAEIILASADGEANISIAHRFGVSNPTVCHWRKKWFEQGVYGEARSGRPRTYDEERVAGLLRTVLQESDRRHTLDSSLRRCRDRPLQEHGRRLPNF
ncbi:MAG TPA: helix-turn-helix domain-containing protein, partial [Roseiarcus sp.]